MLVELVNKHFCKFFNTKFIFRITNVKDLPIANSIFVLNNPEQTFDAI